MGDRDVRVAIIGAGPAGLAVGGALARRGIRATLLERDEPAASWRRHYEPLHLHTIRSLWVFPVAACRAGTADTWRATTSSATSRRTASITGWTSARAWRSSGSSGSTGATAWRRGRHP